MEIIIYATFLVLSLLAYAARQVANRGEEKKVSVSNINFKSFQKSFFLVYFCALLGDWLQGPYVYKLYAFYGFKESQIAVLYVAGFASSVVFGTCTGPIADIWGRKKNGDFLCCDLHILLFNQIKSKLLVASHRENLWRNIHINVVFYIRVLVCI